MASSWHPARKAEVDYPSRRIIDNSTRKRGSVYPDHCLVERPVMLRDTETTRNGVLTRFAPHSRGHRNVCTTPAATSCLADEAELRAAKLARHANQSVLAAIVMAVRYQGHDIRRLLTKLTGCASMPHGLTTRDESLSASFQKSIEDR
jgi:CMP-N-acetylneuraminic acid synthetase